MVGKEDDFPPFLLAFGSFSGGYDMLNFRGDNMAAVGVYTMKVTRVGKDVFSL